MVFKMMIQLDLLRFIKVSALFNDLFNTIASKNLPFYYYKYNISMQDAFCNRFADVFRSVGMLVVK